MKKYTPPNQAKRVPQSHKLENSGHKTSLTVYLPRAIDKDGDTIDFYLSATGKTEATRRFLGKARNGPKEWGRPLKINTDKAPKYCPAIAHPKKGVRCASTHSIGWSKSQ